ncbi:MAG TPA: hypothetical protein VNL77_00625 [Roseiflexaceae bacterium]|nr:hypothetical protein [Roseiflexaceae bacterium]
MPLPFQPACLPLLLGALPHRSVAQALEVSRRAGGQLLTWPQLPQRSFREQALVQSVVGFPGLVVDAAQSQVYVDRAVAARDLTQLELAYLENDASFAALDADDAAGLAELLRQRDSLRGVLAVKGQLLGPISAAAQLIDEQQRPLIYDEALFEALAHHLYLRAAWQEQYLREVADATIICLDEPFLDVVGMPFLPLDWERVREQIEIVLAGVHGCRALYACGAVEWEQVLQTSVDMIIADVYAFGHALTSAAPALAALLERGGFVGLGLVPTDEEVLAHTTPEQLLRRAVALLGDLETAGVPSAQLARQAVVAPSGTLSQLSVPLAERALQLLGDVSRLMREHYRLS